VILASPGHSEVLLEIEGSTGPVRILFDAWLSDFAFGDFMQRNPRVDLGSIGKLDAVYISHSHCDHLDPYTLTALYQKQTPVLVVPETIEFLVPLLSKFLPGASIEVLRHNKTSNICGLSWTGFAFAVPYLTNEEDVMPLVIRSKKESVFFEADIALPDSQEAHGAVDRAMGETERVFVSTRNELEALYASYDAKTPQERKQKLTAYRRRRKDELYWEYARYAELELPCPFRPGSLKLITGQGMIFPVDLSREFLPLSNPFPLADVTALEVQAARETGYDLKLMTLEAGEQIDSRTIKKSKSQIKVEQTRLTRDPAAPAPAPRPQGPLFDDLRDHSLQKQRILHILNNRFVPHMAYHREEPLKALLLARGSYTIRILYGTSSSHRPEDYTIRFADMKFSELKEQDKHEESARRSKTKPDEIYWANDLDDFLNGRQDQFSTTLHNFFEGTAIRLWTMLGLPFLNNDLIEAKVGFHFERAASGHTVNDWIEQIKK
jgi:hypothetical protein